MWMEYSRNVNVIPLLMEIGDRVQTLNTLCPITGEIVDMYKNLVTIADDDAETVDQLLSFHADDLEVISWITKKSLSATKEKLISTQAHRLSLDWWTISTTVCSIRMWRWTSGILRCVWKLWWFSYGGFTRDLSTHNPWWFSTRPLLFLGRTHRRGLLLAGRIPARWLYVRNLFWYRQFQ